MVMGWDLLRHDSVKAICGNLLLHYIMFMFYHFLASYNVFKYRDMMIKSSFCILKLGT